mgnify:CR=1 FL=1
MYKKCRSEGAGAVLLDSSLIPSPPIMPQDRARVRSMIPVSGLRLDPLVPVPDHVVVGRLDGPVHRDAREAALVEELLPGTAEEPFRGGVVRRTAFRARRTRQVVVLADADPLGPPVVAATVGMDDWFLAVLERGACVGEHAVGQRRVRAGADRSGDRHAGSRSRATGRPCPRGWKTP